MSPTSGFAQSLQWQLIQHMPKSDTAAGKRASPANHHADQADQWAEGPGKVEYIMHQRPAARCQEPS